MIEFLKLKNNFGKRRNRSKSNWNNVKTHKEREISLLVNLIFPLYVMIHSFSASGSTNNFIRRVFLIIYYITLLHLEEPTYLGTSL
jgi:hypothetical protein